MLFSVKIILTLVDGVHFHNLDVILLKERKALHYVQQFADHRVL